MKVKIFNPRNIGNNYLEMIIANAKAKRTLKTNSPAPFSFNRDIFTIQNNPQFLF